jgi:hypothetical protein
MFKTRLVCVFGMSAIALSGCGLRERGDLEVEAAESTVDSSITGEGEAALLADALEDDEVATVAALDPEQAAARIAARAGRRLEPAGCAVGVAEGSLVTLTYDDCVGPRGLVHATGVLTIAVSLDALGALVFDAHAEDFELNRAVFDIDSRATFEIAAGGARRLAVATAGTGVGPMGRELERTGDYVATWDDACVRLDGAWATRRGELSRSTEVSLERCRDACAVGTVTRDTFDGRRIEIVFDGTSTVAWSGPRRSGTFEIDCGR